MLMSHEDARMFMTHATTCTCHGRGGCSVEDAAAEPRAASGARRDSDGCGSDDGSDGSDSSNSGGCGSGCGGDCSGDECSSGGVTSGNGGVGCGAESDGAMSGA